MDCIRVCFNSRPHEEVDAWCRRRVTALFVSTHDLTKRSTRIVYFAIVSLNVSTHDLTKRSTSRILLAARCAVMFQLTTSRRGRHRIFFPNQSGFTFQLTTSRRGRLLRHQYKPTTHTCFNSRPHEEVDLCLIASKLTF